MSRLTSVLLVEDDETDVLLLQRAFKNAEIPNPLEITRDGQEAIDFLSRARNPGADFLPALILLDLKMPRKSGMDVLAWKREQQVIATLPVIVFSSSAHRDDVERAYALGANAFLVKPPSLGERLKLIGFMKQWLAFNQPPLACIEGFHSAQDSYARRAMTGQRAAL